LLDGVGITEALGAIHQEAEQVEQFARRGDKEFKT
jgi:CII-binding regulator of phage lambda lysogenization HflD